ncbi:hypothetical protein GF337_05685 [candidate division KSB1 bacterium]|nr:hypothetical protein [candidate division KSB1 bacterium]
MILVLADDFTGAAEIAGIAMRYNLSVEIQHKQIVPTKKELLVVDTDSRSMSSAEAGERVSKMIAPLPIGRIDWIYKKTDSVLRGNVLAELESILKKMNKNAALLIPANPSLGRTIIDGIYYVNGIPLHQTEFANDPEHPAKTSDPLLMLGKSNVFKTHLLKAKKRIPVYGISIAEVSTIEELFLRTMQLTDSVIPAGGSDFFDAIMKVGGYISRVDFAGEIKLEKGNILIVCGSTSEASRSFVTNAEEKGMYVSEMPEPLFNARQIQSNLIKNWSADIISIINEQRKVIITINKPLIRDGHVSKRLREIMAAAVAEVIQHLPVRELMVEGGATAAAIMQRLGWHIFYPLQEFSRGIVRMQVAENPKLNLTIKPGSYAWDEKLISQFQID